MSVANIRRLGRDIVNFGPFPPFANGLNAVVPLSHYCHSSLGSISCEQLSIGIQS
jgi:hypothetical protein